MRKGCISNQPLREAFERSGVSLSQLALRLGYTRVARKKYVKQNGDISVYTRITGDVMPVKRRLGLCATAKGLPPQQGIAEPTALRYCEALGLDPVDIGL